MKDIDTTQLTPKPPQRVSRKKRVANNYKHTKETMEHYISKAAFDPATGSSREKQKKYQIYNNIFPEEWFKFVKNPYNTSNKDYLNFPARIRELTIIRPNMDLLSGEFLKRPFNKMVNNYSEDAYNTYLQAKMDMIKSNLVQHFKNNLIEMGVIQEGQKEDVELPAKLADQFDADYKDTMAIKGQKMVNRIEREAEMEEQFMEMFKDWMVAGEAYSFKDEIDGMVEYTRISPLDFDYGKSPNTRYVEDGEWAIRRIRMTTADLVDRFYSSITKKDIEEQESPYNVTTPATLFSSIEEQNENVHTHEVLHIVWKTQVKYGLFYYPDPLTGEIQMEEVDETFKMPEELKGIAKIKWEWENEVWEGYRVMGTLYLEMGPRMGKNLPYNGRRFSDTHSQNVSIMDMGIPYQILYIIINYRLELTIAKSKGKIVLLDQKAIPNTEGWDEDKFFYYADATGWGLLNRDQIGVDKTYNQYQVVDLGLYEHIANLVQILQHIKDDWDEVMGINRQRKGQTMASDKVGANERAVFQSSVMSELTFFSFEKLMERDYQGILELTPTAYLDGIHSVYTSDDMRTEILSVTPEELTMAELGIFVTSSTKDIDRVRQLKEYAQQSLVAGGNLGTIAKVVASDNMAEILRLLKSAEREEAELIRKTEDSKLAQEERVTQLEQQNEILMKALDEQFMNAEYDRKEILEHIKGQYTNTNAIIDTPAPPESPAEIQKLATDATKTAADIRQKDKELNLKDKEIESKERIEKEKNKTALKNKVVGEK
jgi:hypothetical protein